jgi:hypothetical protein
LLFIILLNLLGSILWFVKFPVFRYGYGYLISFFGITYIFILSKLFEINIPNLKKKINIIILICIIAVLGKHTFRIYKNYDIKTSPWPMIYSDNKTKIKNEMFPHYQKDKVILYTPELSMCYYSDLSPCTNMANSEFNVKEIKFDKVLTYKKYYFVE